MRAAKRADVIAGHSRKVSFHRALVVWWKRVGRNRKNFSSVQAGSKFLAYLKETKPVLGTHISS